jgi:hypothetical protein
MTKPSQPELMDTSETAKYLNVSPASLNAWRANGNGPPFLKVSTLVRYSRADVDSWLASRRRTSTADVPISFGR